MFAPHCPSCDRRVLLGARHIQALRSEGGEHRVDLRCTCGSRVRWLGGAAVARSAARATSP